MSLNKIRPQSPKEKINRYLWSTSFTPDYSATGLATKMWTNSQRAFILSILYFYRIWPLVFKQTKTKIYIRVCHVCGYNHRYEISTFIRSMYIGDSFWQNVGDSDMWQSATVLALATLGDTTQIGSFLFMSRRPRWPRKVRKLQYT